VVCGYSFSDEHINAIIFDALEARQRPHVIALQYADPIEGDTLDARARRQPNLMVLGPSTAIIGGVKGDWKLHDSKLATTFSDAFSPDPPPEAGVPAPGTGKFLLGDFAKFTDFLASLSGVN
jgi:hypothetical protein